MYTVFFQLLGEQLGTYTSQSTLLRESALLLVGASALDLVVATW